MSGTPGVGEARRTDLAELAEYFDKTDAGELVWAEPAGALSAVSGWAVELAQAGWDRRSSSARARLKTASSMGSVRRPVLVFWRLGW